MKILFDHQIFTWQQQGGISRYFVEIIRHTSRRKDVEYQLALVNSLNVHFAEAKLRSNVFIRLFNCLKIALLSKMKQTSHFNQACSVNALKSQQFDVFVPTYYDTYFLEFLGNKPFVLTVHDMIHELYPAYFSGVETLISQKKILIYKATKIIAISENTKNDILRIYPEVNKDKIEVVYLGHSIKTTETKVSIELPRRYILFVGERGIYKNFDFFIKSAAAVLKNDADLFVLCVGGRSFTENENTLFDELGIKRQLLQYTATDAELYTLYNKALVFVFPSLYEGFGMPVLEAMVSKCPVILTNASSFPEVASDAAAFFNAGDSEGLKKLIKEIVYEEDKRNIYIENGVKNTNRFSWEKTTDSCVRIYKSVAVAS